MLANNTVRQSEAACPFPVFLAALDNPAPSFAGPPRTLRDHIGKREFGDFGAVLMANHRPSADLPERVAKWRAVDAATRKDLPLQAHPDQIAEDRNFNLIFVAAPTAITVWVIISLIAAWHEGLL